MIYPFTFKIKTKESLKGVPLQFYVLNRSNFNVKWP